MEQGKWRQANETNDIESEGVGVDWLVANQEEHGSRACRGMHFSI